jgi:prepilin-type N-terminal cleavage/methylation domain-containing protein
MGLIRPSAMTPAADRRPFRASPGPFAPSAARSAFTLIELLVVIGLIVVILGLALPAFNAITGSRSTEAARNIISANLGRARAEAMNRKAQVGVFFYLDPARDRTAVAIVQRSINQFDDPDPLDSYRMWQPNFTYRRADSAANRTADRVIFITRDDTETSLGGTGRPLVKRYRCIQDATGASQSPPRTGPTPPAAEGRFRNQWWEDIAAGDIDLLEGTEVQYLPTGVGVQLLNDQRQYTNAASPTTYVDRYLRTGLILFDEQGRVSSADYSVATSSLIGQALGLTASIGTTESNQNQRFASVGFVMYDQSEFRNATRITSDYPGATSFTDLTYTATEGDWLGPVLVGYQHPSQLPGGPAQQLDNERKEELWLDNNTTPYMVSRFSGSLLATE